MRIRAIVKEVKMENGTKESFGSKLGFILAAAGSAVGLGNIWRFPYLAAQYNGAVFVIIYIILALTFGFALMVTEICIGRKTGKSVISAYGNVHKGFSFLGIIATLVPLIIVPYYCVIGGWVCKYFFSFVTGQGTAAAQDGYFSSFTGEWLSPTIFFLIFAILTGLVVMLGVQNGIEKISKILMPVLLVLIIGIAIYVMTLPGAIDGLRYYLVPDFRGYTFKQFIDTVVAAMGQMFYSLSLAMGIMVTYGAYMRKEDHVEKSVLQIEFFDSLVAVLAGLIIVPAVIIFSGEEALGAGPSLMFVTLPKVFQSMPGGQIIGTAFFLMVILAALTSSISLMEVVVAVVMEKLNMKRLPACLITFGAIIILGMLSVFGYSIWDTFTIIGYQFLDFFDFISNNVMMPILALLTCILIGWVVRTESVEQEVLVSVDRFKTRKLYKVMTMIICPIFMIIILLNSFIKF